MPQFSDALFTDLYQLTMAQAYFQSGQTGDATFSLYFRGFPSNRAYYVFCGLESAVEYMGGFGFSERDLAALERLGIFDGGFLDYLRSVRFTGSARAMAEGEVFFPAEPALEVSGPIIECQLLETYLVNQISLESMLAAKAARVVDAANGRQVVDFGARRAHGRDAAMKLARASYMAGFDGSSNIAAADAYGIPAVGTMAHSFISSFDDEREAFRSYARSFPDSSTFLVDTYDTVGGVRSAIAVAGEMESDGRRLRAVRLDSGDMDSLSREARRMLDDAGLSHVRILASGGLDEYAIDELARRGAPIDGFGVGTRVGTSADAPYTDFVYKLVEYGGKPMMKLSEGKVSLPMAKQVSRLFDDEGAMRRDVIHAKGMETRLPDSSAPLLGTVIERGSLTAPLPDLESARAFHAGRIAQLPRGLRGVKPSGGYDVRVAAELEGLAAEVSERLRSESGRAYSTAPDSLSRAIRRAE